MVNSPMGQPLEGSGRQASADLRCSRKDGWLPVGIWRLADTHMGREGQNGPGQGYLSSPNPGPRLGVQGPLPSSQPSSDHRPCSPLWFAVHHHHLGRLTDPQCLPCPKGHGSPTTSYPGSRSHPGSTEGPQWWSPRPPVLPSCSAPQGQGASIQPTLWPGPWGMHQGGRGARSGSAHWWGFSHRRLPSPSQPPSPLPLRIQPPASAVRTPPRERTLSPPRPPGRSWDRTGGVPVCTVRKECKMELDFDFEECINQSCDM